MLLWFEEVGVIEKVKRHVPWLKVVAFVGVLLLVLYALLYIFAPHQLQRLGSFFRSTFGEPTKRVITIATAEKGGHYFRLGNILKKEMKRQRGQEVLVLNSGGTLDNVQLVRRKKADFAFIQGAIQEGSQAEFDGLRAVATIGWQYVHIVTPDASPVSEFRDLKGRTISIGPGKSGNDALGRLVFEFYSKSDIRLINTEAKLESIVEDFKKGVMEAIFLAYDLHAPLMEELLRTGNYRLVPIHEAQSIAYTIPGCFSTILPHSTYGPNREIPVSGEGGFPTLRVKTLLITQQGMNRYVVQNMLQTLYSTRFIKQSRLPELNEEKGRHVFDLPLHRAADRFYRRNDPVTADKYEIGAAFLAALLFLASVVSFFSKRTKARQLEKKKLNIIPYFEELLKYSQRMAQAKEIGELKELLEQMMAMQRNAEKKWLSGDLDTEHMENLYAIYGIRCDNAFNRMTLLQMVKHQELLETTAKSLQRAQESEEK
jgi:TRAP transporter TAXI family solute receptor